MLEPHVGKSGRRQARRKTLWVNHIHYVVNAPGYKEKIFEIVFEGDVFIDERMREDARSEDSIFSIRPLEKTKEGMLSCVQNIKMRR